MKKSKNAEKMVLPSKADNKAEKRRIAEQKRANKAQDKKQREILREQQRAEHEKVIAAKNALAAERRKRRTLFYGKIKAKLKNRPEGFSKDGNRGIIPRVELEVNGDRASVAARFVSCGIKFEDMRADGGVTRFKTRKKDLHKVIAILDEMCYNYRISATFGIGRVCAFWLSRCGLIAGMIASVVCLNIAYGYVWRVSIVGNDKLSDAAIMSVLDASGVSVGSKKTVVDGMKAQSALVGLHGIADASCVISGTTMYVRVLESSDYTEPVGCAAYISEYDATVTRVVVRSGTAAVKRGDVVKKGALLASGDVYSTAGELLYTGECDADVYGNVAVTVVADISPTYVEYRRTGNVERRTQVELFGFGLGKTQSTFASYETVARKTNYDVLLPLYVTRYEYYETAPIELTRDIDEAVKAFALSKIEEMSFSGKFDYSYNVTELVSGLYTVHLFLSGETIVSTPVDTVPVSPEQENTTDNDK